MNSKYYSIILKNIAYIGATFVILFAIFFTSVRVVTPMLDAHREEIQKWASALLNMPVHIQKSHLSWYQYQPEVTLDQVTLLNKDSLQPSLKIQHVSVLFSIPKSIWQWKPVPSGIVIEGTSIHLKQDSHGELYIKGFPTGFGGEPYQGETKFKDILSHLYEQPRIILKSVDVRFVNEANVERYITLYDLRLENSRTHHRLLGKAVLHQDVPTEISLVLKWAGNDVDLNKIHAKIYLYVSGLTVNQWFKNFHWQDWEIRKGIISAKIWAEWNRGQLQKIQSLLLAYDIQLHSLVDDSVHVINRLNGNFGWKREKQQIIFAADDLLLDLPNRLWPITNFYIVEDISNQKPELKHFYIGYLNIKDILPFVPSLKILDDHTKQLLLKLNPSGSILNTQIDFESKDLLKNRLRTEFNQLAFQNQDNIPGLENFSGKLNWDSNSGSLSIQSHHLILSNATLFLRPIVFNELRSTMFISTDHQNNWLLTIKDFQAITQDLKAKILGQINFSAQDSPIINLKANFSMSDVRHICNYLPLPKLNLQLNGWLKNAFEAGQIDQGEAILKGKLNEFPFDEGRGLFKLSGQLKNLNLHYAPDWPSLNHIQGALQFLGRQLQINVQSASILNIPLQQVKAEIPYLGSQKPEILKVEAAPIVMNLNQGINFIETSPLKKNIGKLFANLKGAGPIKLLLKLTVPLKKAEDTQVAAKLNLNPVSLYLMPWNLAINNVKGEIDFTEKTAVADNIQGLFFNKPVKLNLSTLTQSNSHVIRAALITQLNMNDLQNWLNIPITSVAKGEAFVSGLIDMGIDTPISMQFHSNLQGITITLPDEFAKTNINDTKAFDVKISIPEKDPLRIKLQYNKRLSVAALLKRKNEKFELSAANIQLGGGEANWPVSNGLAITGVFDTLTWDKMKDYLSSHAKTNMDLSSIKTIDIRAKLFSIFGQQFNQLRIQIVPKKNRWAIQLKSPDVTGTLDLPMEFNPRSTVTAQFEKLYLQTLNDKNSPSLQWDVKSLPRILFYGHNIFYNGNSLGQIDFRTDPNSDGLTIEKLNISSSNMMMQADGSWNGTNTHIKGFANSDNISELLIDLGFDPHNFITQSGKINFDINWKGAPYSPSLANLNGKLVLNIDKGRIVDVGQTGDATMGIGRILSIFSLQSLPRRLTFDFSDIFQKGYSFNYIRGDFHFKNGNAITDNLKFDGPVARVDIDGRIGLKNKDYDLTLGVTPYVTSTIPVAAAILGAPTGGVGAVAAVAAFAVNSIITPKLITYHYAIKGSWENPSVEGGNS